MNEEQKDINEFDELFKEHNIKVKPEIPKSNSPYYLSIMYYLLIMFVVSTIIGIVFITIDPFKRLVNQDELVIEAIVSDPTGISLMPESVYQLYEADYTSYVVGLGNYDSLVVVVSLYNEAAINYLLDDDQTLIYDKVTNIITGYRTYWDDANQFMITIYESSLNPLPMSVTAETVVIAEPTLDLTRIAYSLWNFLIYIALTPVLVFVLLKRDITADILVFKKRWNEFIPAVLIGYALVIVGNIVANFASSEIASALGQIQSTATNQLSIEQTLNSSGMILMFVSAVFLGPIAEELIFRKSIFSLIKNEYIALFVSALVFGGVHLLNETSFAGVAINGVVYVMMGLVFGYIYIRNKKNVAISITVHMLSNLISVLAALLLF